MNGRMKRWTANGFVVAMLVLFAQAAWAGERPAPLEFLKDKTKAVLAVVDRKVSGDAEIQKRATDLRVLIEAMIDYDDLAVRSLGDHWAVRTPEEQAAYKALFKELVELTYVDRLGDKNPDAKYEIEWESQSTNGDMGRGICFLLYEDTETELEFTLKAANDTWLVHDLAIDGARVEETYRRNYSKTIEEQGFDGLMKKMQKRVDELKAKKKK